MVAAETVGTAATSAGRQQAFVASAIEALVALDSSLAASKVEKRVQVQEKIAHIPDNNFGYFADFVVAAGDSPVTNHRYAVRHYHYFLLSDYFVLDSSYYS